jgi:hypothetical protein
MPDPKEMSGIPRPVTDLPNGTVSVRVIKGELSNNIANQTVELLVGGQARTAKTDEAGRAQFDKLPAGAPLRASTVVDGERLESQEFPAPTQGGIRLMLVATDKEKERRKAEEASAPAIPGQVVIGQKSQIVIELDEESLDVFYILEIVNNARAPVNPTQPFVFRVAGSRRTTLLRGTSQLASVKGNEVSVAGPFPPGPTMVQVAASMPVGSGTVEIVQAFPAALEGLLVVAKKDGDMKLTSAQFQRQQDTMSSNTPVIVGVGGAVAAGQPISVTVSGLPHHSAVPQYVALGLAVLTVLVGGWAIAGGDRPQRDEARKQLIARREKLFQELVRLEHDQRRGRRDAGRREELLAALEHVYGALDADAEPAQLRAS